MFQDFNFTQADLSVYSLEVKEGIKQAFEEQANRVSVRVSTLGLRLQDAESRLISTQAEIASTESEISVYDSVLPTLPEGAVKQDMEGKKTRAEYKLFTLNSRSSSPIQLFLLRQQYQDSVNSLTVFTKHIEAIEASLV